ncbi:hypothetical protein GUJ93_ZPchr0002g25997 [Zizania palustris]|uniref:Vesicle transport protein n=1 Tax=Zizania palustris TaxID=103762 RepID=A0A8J5SIX4_ZIZPA|nr:hypothetical protein GUJ93_ZPchr0002g25997 [Zizania palustris]
MDTMRGALERAKMLVGMEVDEESALPPPEEQSFFDDVTRNCALTTTQRLYGFAICLAAGLTCTFLMIGDSTAQNLWSQPSPSMATIVAYATVVASLTSLAPATSCDVDEAPPASTITLLLTQNLRCFSRSCTPSLLSLPGPILVMLEVEMTQ